MMNDGVSRVDIAGGKDPKFAQLVMSCAAKMVQQFNSSGLNPGLAKLVSLVDNQN